MPYRTKTSNRNTSIPVRLITGFLIAWAITILGGIIITNLVDKEVISANTTQPAVVITMFAAAFISSFTVGAAQKEQKPVFPILNAAIYFISLFGTNALFFEGEYQGVMGTLLTITGSGIIAALLITMQKKQRTAYTKPFRKR